MRATSSIPIVTIVAPNPIGMGLAQSLARPGGNITGLTTMDLDI
jgi:putative ABC transport system substrate-binding protein